ncbi:MAG TPA: efflux RND transporter periplasmic adaptor subunit [Verrucomicrobiae bacterium]|nr:efflux RND transporter periplasmic adaptor subunit [Verrucomicrobiae bacterium]
MNTFQQAKWTAPVALLPLVAVALGGCGRKASTAPPPPPRPVEVASAVARDVPLYIDEIGTCAAVETVVVQPQVSGSIAKIHFKDGADVRKGDPLFSIDRRPFEAERARAEAALAQDRVKRDFAGIKLRRAEKLRQAGTISPEEFDAAKSEADAAAAQVHADEASLAAAQINLDYCEIRSPIDGRTGDRKVDIGNVVEANKARLLEVRRQDPIYVQFTVPEADLPRVRAFLTAKSLSAEVSIPSEPDQGRTGRVDFLDNTVQGASGTVRLRVVVENADRRFWPGQFVNVRLLLDTLKGAVLVPARAVQVGQRGPFVFVVKKDATVDLRQVKPGQRQGDEIVIFEGVAAGEVVVTAGQLTLSPGTAVAVVGGAHGS